MSSFLRSTDPLPVRRRALRPNLTALIWLLVAAVVVSLAIFKITEFDIWWHLRAGQYILSHHTVPTHDVFSFTAKGRPWITHEWLFEVIAFLIYQVGSLSGLILFNAFIVLLTFFFTFLTLRRLDVDVLIAAPLTIMAAFVVTFRAFTRPDVMTQCLLALYLLVLLSFKHVPAFRARRNRLWLLLVVQLFWANIHSGMILGFGLFALFGVTELLQYYLSRHTGWLARTALPVADSAFILKLAGAMFLVSFLNPNLHKALLYPFIMTLEPVFSGGIRELQSPLLRMFWPADFFYCFVLLLVIGIVSFILNRRRLELTSLAIFIISAATAVKALRNLPIFALLTLPLIALNFQQAAFRNPRPGVHRGAAVRRGDPPSVHTLQSYARPVLALIFAVVLVMVFTRGVNVTNYYRKPGLGYDARVFPVQAGDFVAEHNIRGNIFSTMEYGGYFLWRWYPEHLAFIDGRCDCYGRDFFEQYGRMFWSGPEFDSITRHYDINCCVLPEPPSNTTATRDYIGRTLGQRTDWSLVYWDDLALIYLRRTPDNQPLIDRCGYRAIVPTLLGLPHDTSAPDQRLAEARRAISESPKSPLAQTILAVVELNLSQFDQAEPAFQAALNLDPEYADALLGLAVVYSQTGKPDQEITTLERLVKSDRHNSIAYFNLGSAYLKNGDLGRAEQALSHSLQLNSDLAPASVMLGDVYLQTHRYSQARAQWESVLETDPGNQSVRDRLDRLRSLGH